MCPGRVARRDVIPVGVLVYSVPGVYEFILSSRCASACARNVWLDVGKRCNRTYVTHLVHTMIVTLCCVPQYTVM